ncbi:uncharacterized protein BKA78DRAFT_77008 [Phyllosticta capitalensis]|uniref:uncharacterized protein n=1 Tax=Phyllosticta capitalensis TaxID=121624 RepID=UPI003131F3DC
MQETIHAVIVYIMDSKACLLAPEFHHLEDCTRHLNLVLFEVARVRMRGSQFDLSPSLPPASYVKSRKRTIIDNIQSLRHDPVDLELLRASRLEN